MMLAPLRRVAVGSDKVEGIMRKKLLGSFVVVVLVAVTAFGFRADADAQNTATQGHSLVGTWLVDTDPETSDNALDTLSFTADGTATDVEPGGFVTLGAWEATGEQMANLTMVAYELDEDGSNVGSTTIRVSIEVSADGTSFTGEYTIEFIQPDGTSNGEAGPGIVTGERLAVEGQGTPAMTLGEFFGQFEGQEGRTEDATPVP